MNLEAAIEAAAAWIAADPDPETKSALARMVEQRDPDLVEVMSGSLAFGTAGLRAVVGPGPMRMNSAVVRRTTAGVARYLKRKHGEQSLVVVGADARLSSASFQADTCAVLAGYGLRVRYFPEPTATPMVAYAARRLGAKAAIVVTASHNPAQYNGYKLYGESAIQIVAPVDSEVAEEIARSLPANQERYDGGALEHIDEHCAPVEPALVEDYFRDVAKLRPAEARARDLKIVYTAMHGVGYKPVARVLQEAGFANFHSVGSQQRPDGKFPTVAFPNPEEPGALDAAMALGASVAADLIIANDPDVDRLAASLPTGGGEFRQLTGNQLGLLLADYLLETAPKSPQPLVAQSIVSSPMLESIARDHGAHFEQTFTGFKWIWTAAMDLMANASLNYVFGYEEALGYCAGQLVRDKDGISAALLLCELAASEKARGSSLGARLERLYRKHGLWVSVQRSVTLAGLSGAAQIEQAMSNLHRAPPPLLGNETVTKVRDFSKEGSARPRWLDRASLVELTLSRGQRVLVRPSGTEPKLKVYVDLCQELDDEESFSDREANAVAEAHSIAQVTLAHLGMG